MLRRGRAAGVLAALLLFMVSPLTGVWAQNVDVNIGVGDTILTVVGKTSPGAFVTISRDGGVIGTTTAAADGSFAQTYPAQTPGLHQISVFASTTGGNNTDTVTSTVNISEHNTTTADVFLPSTITIADDDLDFGQPLQLSGETVPSATVSLFIDNMVYATANSDAAGNWSLLYDTAGLSNGQHSLFVRVTDGFGAQSSPTSLRYFSIASSPESPDRGSDGTDSPAPSGPIGNGEIPARPNVPVITFPKSGSDWSEGSITIRGRADPRVQIELWDGHRNIGSVWSDKNGDWLLPLNLEPRKYDLRARACIRGVCSEFSEITSFTYRPGGVEFPYGQSLIVELPRSSFTVFENERLRLKAKVIKGQPPYQTAINWEDGRKDSARHTGDDLFFNHTYNHSGKYTVSLDVKDAQGRRARAYATVNVLPVSSAPRLMFILLPVSLLLLLLAMVIYIKYRARRRRG